MAVPFQHNLRYTCASSWRGQATCASPFVSLNDHSAVALTSGIRSKATLLNEAPKKGDFFRAEYALIGIGIQFIREHALEHRSQMNDVVFLIYPPVPRTTGTEMLLKYACAYAMWRLSNCVTRQINVAGAFDSPWGNTSHS